MPCSPNDIGILHYALPETLGRFEGEEAAARIISFSQQLDQWVGVSWRRLAQMMQAEFDASRSVEEARSHNFHERERIKRAGRRYIKRSILTLGIYALFVAKPTAQLREVPDVTLPLSGIFVTGPGHVVTGIRELIGEGFLKLVTREGFGDVLFPTPELLSRIMQRQGVATT